MKTIHKFRIESNHQVTTLTLREGYRVVRCEYVLADKAVYLWVEQPLNVATPSLEQKFRLAMSGDPVPDDYSYVGTALDPFGPEAYHLFQLPAAVKRSVTPIRKALGSLQAGNDAEQQRASA